MLAERLPADTSAPRAARQLVAEALASSGADGSLDDTLLMVSELVTNACVHAGSDITLQLFADGRAMRVEVADGGQLAPDRCGNLVIGGFRLRDGDMKRLGQGASALFAQRNVGHIAAIVIISLGVHLQNVKLVNGTPVIDPGTSLYSTVSIERWLNP